jgi:hypothetical protein
MLFLALVLSPDTPSCSCFAGFVPVSSSDLFAAWTLASLLGFSVGALMSVEVLADQITTGHGKNSNSYTWQWCNLAHTP